MSKQHNNLAQQLATVATRRQNETPQSASVAETMRKPEDPLNTFLSARTTAEFKDELKMYALQAGMSIQDLVHEALEEYMHRHPVN